MHERKRSAEERNRFFEFTRTMEAYKKTLSGSSTLILGPEAEFFKYLKKRR